MPANVSIPTDPSDRRKFFIALGIIIVCAIWLCYYIATHVSINHAPKPLDSPGWRVANDITARLNADPKYVDVALGVASEKPLKLNVIGFVHSRSDLDALPDLIKQTYPDAEYDFKVDVIH